MSVEKIRMGDVVPFSWTGLGWYCVQFRRHMDHHARAVLEAAGVPVFLVEGRRAERDHRGTGKRVLRDYLAFEGYGFVGDLDKLRAVMARYAWDDVGPEIIDGVCVVHRLRGMASPFAGILGCDGVPQRVNGLVMGALFAAHDAGAFVPGTANAAVARTLRIGESVRVTVGPFAEIEGVVSALHGGKRVEILAQLFGGQQAVTVGLDSLALS